MLGNRPRELSKLVIFLLLLARKPNVGISWPGNVILSGGPTLAHLWQDYGPLRGDPTWPAAPVA